MTGEVLSAATSSEDRRRFLADVNVGRLARWLRMFGYDVRLEREASDGDLVRIALQEGRILLTRDHRLAFRRIAFRGPLRVFLLNDDDVRRQFRQVVTSLGLSDERALTRCVQCNAVLHARQKEDVAGRVPPYTYSTHERFKECPACGRVYWRGAHWDRMQEEVAWAMRSAG